MNMLLKTLSKHKINPISFGDISEEYTFVSFYFESLFPNVPLKKTIEIILNRACSDKQISTTLSKRLLKKLLLVACTKTAFTFNKELYGQIDSVSKGSPLDSLMANVLMTELECVWLLRTYSTRDDLSSIFDIWMIRQF